MDGEAASEEKHISAQSDRAAREARKVHLGWGYSVSASCGVSPLGFFAAADSPHLPFFEFEFLCEVFFRFPIFSQLASQVEIWKTKVAVRFLCTSILKVQQIATLLLFIF